MAYLCTKIEDFSRFRDVKEDPKCQNRGNLGQRSQIDDTAEPFFARDYLPFYHVCIIYLK